MAYQRLQVNNSVDVIPSDTVDIPDPATKVLVGNADMSVAGTLTDVGTTFLTDGIQKNAILYGVSSGLAYTVVSVDSDTQLTVTPAVAGAPGEAYTIYNAATLGATLYVGGAGNLVTVMASNRDIGVTAIPGVNPSLFTNVPQGSFMPILVTRVRATATTATTIKALF